MSLADDQVLEGEVQHEVVKIEGIVCLNFFGGLHAITVMLLGHELRMAAY